MRRRVARDWVIGVYIAERRGGDIINLREDGSSSFRFSSELREGAPCDSTNDDDDDDDDHPFVYKPSSDDFISPKLTTPLARWTKLSNRQTP